MRARFGKYWRINPLVFSLVPRFFESLGFTRSEWPTLRSALLHLGQDGASHHSVHNQFISSFAAEHDVIRPRRGLCSACHFGLY